jgi:hypothetical protein
MRPTGQRSSMLPFHAGRLCAPMMVVSRSLRGRSRCLDNGLRSGQRG